MMRGDFFIHYQNSSLHYAKGGHGPRHLLLFHGFGQSHEVFGAWVAQLGQHYTLYAFDLYFHGASRWAERKPLAKADWQQILCAFLEQENIARFEVAGFSMGGKFALASVELFAHRIDRLILLAPDGIKTSFWYSLATYPLATRSLFKSLIRRPDRLYRMVRLLRAMNLVDKGLLRFAESQMNTEEKRLRVYCAWVYFRHLRFDLAHVAGHLNRHRIPLAMITGRYDKIITTANMQAFVRAVKHAQALEIDVGHNDLVARAGSLPVLAPSPA